MYISGLGNVYSVPHGPRLIFITITITITSTRPGERVLGAARPEAIRGVGAGRDVGPEVAEVHPGGNRYIYIYIYIYK